MADKQIVELPANSGVTNETLFPAYQPGAVEPAQKVSGAQFRAFAEQAGAAAGEQAAGDLARGGTFTPHFDPATGLLSWTNDLGLPNPDPVQLEGVSSVNGKTGAVQLGAADVGAELAGLVRKRYQISGEDEVFIATVNSVYESMPDSSVRYIDIGFSTAHPVIGGAVRLVKIYRATSTYGALEAFSYIVGAGADVYYRSFTNGVWGDFTQDVHTGNIASYAAPAGFGLGVSGAVTEITDCNDATANGWYRTAGALNVPVLGGVAHSYGWMFVSRSAYIRQDYYADTEDPVHCVRYCVNNVWSEWDCVNPPMKLGVEYRTTERFGGQPVYTRLIKITPLVIGQNQVAFSESFTYPARQPSGGMVGSDGARRGLPFVASDQSNQNTYVVQDHLRVTVFLGSFFTEAAAGTQTAYVQIWYTKTAPV